VWIILVLASAVAALLSAAGRLGSCMVFERRRGRDAFEAAQQLASDLALALTVEPVALARRVLGRPFAPQRRSDLWNVPGAVHAPAAE
jgi:hypothetical protein